MWHESRAEEKKVKGAMVDRKKRAERRKEHYEKAQADPTQCLQVCLGTPGAPDTLPRCTGGRWRSPSRPRWQ